MMMDPQGLWPGKSLLADTERAALLEKLHGPFGEALETHELESVTQALERVYLPLAAWIANRHQSAPLLVGVNGAQGSGKSTLCTLLKRVLELGFNLRVVTLSLDDLYLTHAERVHLSQTVHPLLITRGVPGTHDVGLGMDLLSALKQGESRSIPTFDKAQDDRKSVHLWPNFKGPADMILFEGWCVGARPQKDTDLIAPVNTLEAEADPDGAWRHYVNDQLKGVYANLFDLLDVLIMLKVPSFEHVFAWRGLQEQRLAESVGAQPNAAEGLMGPAELQHFIMHFERLTRAMLDEMPSRADLTLFLGEDHQVDRVQSATGTR